MTIDLVAFELSKPRRLRGIRAVVSRSGIFCWTVDEGFLALFGRFYR